MILSGPGRQKHISHDDDILSGPDATAFRDTMPGAATVTLRSDGFKPTQQGKGLQLQQQHPWAFAQRLNAGIVILRGGVFARRT